MLHVCTHVHIHDINKLLMYKPLSRQQQDHNSRPLRELRVPGTANGFFLRQTKNSICFTGQVTTAVPYTVASIYRHGNIFTIDHPDLINASRAYFDTLPAAGTDVCIDIFDKMGGPLFSGLCPGLVVIIIATNATTITGNSNTPIIFSLV